MESEFAESVREIGVSDEEIEEQEVDPRSVFPWRRPPQPDHPPPGVGVSASVKPPEPKYPPPPPKASPARPPGLRPVRPAEPAYPPPSWGKGSASSSSSASPRPKPILALSSKARPIAKAEPVITIVEEDNNQIDWAYLDRHRVELYHLGERARPATRVDFGRSCVSLERDEFHQVFVHVPIPKKQAQELKTRRRAIFNDHEAAGLQLMSMIQGGELPATTWWESKQNVKSQLQFA